jgi:hypothetical protein
MKRLPALALAFLMCALAVGMSPRPLLALCSFCDTSVTNTTAIVSGTGSDCTAAQSAMTSQLQQLAGATCGALYCNFAIKVTKQCFQLTTGEWRIRGYATYSCRNTDNCTGIQ